MFDEKDTQSEQPKPLDFNSLRKSVYEAVDPVVGAVQKYQPYKGKGKYKADKKGDLPETLATFFRSTADAVEELGTAGLQQKVLNNADETIQSTRLDQKGRKLANQTSEFLGDKGNSVLDAVNKAKIDKKAAALVQNAGDKLASVKLDQKTAGLAANLASSLKDVGLDQKAIKFQKSFGETVKNAELDKKASSLAASLSDTFKNAELDKKAGSLASSVSDTFRNAEFDKKAGNLAATVSETLKNAELDKKASGLAESVAGFAVPVVAAVTDFAGNLGDSIKEAQLDKKLGGVTENIGEMVKDAQLEKKAASVVSSAGEMAGNVGDALSDFFKENKLDKKAAGLAETVGEFAAPVIAKVKEAELDKKASDVAGNIGSRVKDARLDKRIADAQLPERFFEAANLIPGVEIKNPKKSAKQFRKQRKTALKAVSAQQKDLNKLLKKGGSQAGKYIQARQKDIQTGKIRIPGYEPPKQSKGFPWGKSLLLTGLGYGGLAANNLRVWSNVPPLQSKLSGEGKYYRSRQGVIFYKEAGEDKEGQPPVVFMHGIGAGNNSFEWLSNYEAATKNHKTFAFDLLGFGNSERPNLKYTAEVYIKQLTEFLDEVVKQPSIVVASSLSSSYAVQVAYRRPQLIKKLVLMEPTGIFRGVGEMGPNLAGPLSGLVHTVLRTPVLGRAIYSGVASRSGIKSFMENQMYYDKSLVTPEQIEQYWISAHQDGSDFAPPSFFTGLLNAEIGETIGKIEQPIMIVWGKESRITPSQERVALSHQNKKARTETIEKARLSVNQEQSDEFNRLLEDFFSQSGQGQSQKQSGSDSVGFVHNHPESETKPEDKHQPESQVKPVEKPKLEAQAKPQTQNQSGSGQKAGGKSVNVKDKNPLKESIPVSSSPESQLPPVSEKKPDYGSAEESHQRSEMGNTGEASISGASGTGDKAQASTSPQNMSQGDTEKLNHELEEHRKTFIGDANTGGALIQDENKDGIDDRLQ